MDKYSNLAAQIVPVLANSKGLVYVDFIRDVEPLAISLCQKGHKSCAYHGAKMSAHDKEMTLRNWQDGQIQVCTRV